MVGAQCDQDENPYTEHELMLHAGKHALLSAGKSALLDSCATTNCRFPCETANLADDGT
jgi:hypothetical protein